MLAFTLAAVMVFSPAAMAEAVTEGQEAATEAEGTAAEAASGEARNNIVYATASFGQKFSPFFATTAYDMEVVDLTQALALATDRGGAVIYNGIEGETINYNGTDYTYDGLGDVTVTQNDDESVDYTIRIRDDQVFSDGEPMTIDDIIFDMYVFCDPTYDGSTTLFSMPIEGLQEYRSGMDTLFNLLVAAGEDNADYTYWTEEQQTAFWADYNQAAQAFAQEIVDYCKAAGYNEESDSVSACAANWGYELPEEATAMDFWNTMAEAYEGDISAMVSTETAGSSLADLMEDYDAYTVGIETGDSAPSISGIQKLDEHTLRVVATQVDRRAVKQDALVLG